MFEKDKFIGLIVAAMFATGAAQAADQRFKTQVDAETARADIVERAAGGSPETVRSGSGVWGNHSPLTSSIAQTAIGVINEGASAALDQLKTTQDELAQTQTALQSTQAALSLAQSDLQATQSEIDSARQSQSQFEDMVSADLARLQQELENAGGTASEIQYTIQRHLYGTQCEIVYMGYMCDVSKLVDVQCQNVYVQGAFSGGNVGYIQLIRTYTRSEVMSNASLYNMSLSWENIQTDSQARSYFEQQCAAGNMQ